ncbi:hypothetical protein CROQUDRAFT_42219 [Cronartium quercuum f. sp. fusiforme G11]|uniref:Uncharacterized protein n=1 Tax=Cronartium quercuum f. sp. fusiforme G11 TaxID=708437 RepID=A0A9P6NKU5_9BASI|nr:hypothetical protein CROQUDRAFT_42219 [Cronartium quercuum f. sp. fusiforme G11]
MCKKWTFLRKVESVNTFCFHVLGNRKCKSQMSYEKHKASCTHRQGPLTLECRYCKRPYTYIGYLSKHEIECAKFQRVCLVHFLPRESLKRFGDM